MSNYKLVTVDQTFIAETIARTGSEQLIEKASRNYVGIYNGEESWYIPLDEIYDKKDGNSYFEIKFETDNPYFKRLGLDFEKSLYIPKDKVIEINNILPKQQDKIIEKNQYKIQEKFENYVRKVMSLDVNDNNYKLSTVKLFPEGIKKLRELERELAKERVSVLFAPYNFAYASERLRDDEEIVLDVIEDEILFSLASDRLKSDREFIKKAIIENSYVLKHVHENFKDDEEIVKLAVSKRGVALEYAGEYLKDDENIIKIAISNNGRALKYASERLRDSKEIVGLAISKHGNALEYASERIRDNKDIVELAVSNSGRALQFASERLRDSDEIVNLAIFNDKKALQYASDRVKEVVNKIEVKNLENTKLNDIKLENKHTISMKRKLNKKLGRGI
ncbi:MAG: DUF4116 domain-containing protein [Erysipelotrichaceae bacterium]|nr:DUF4116 domain-containing protein [Erysipelotrichaceae bacterium]